MSVLTQPPATAEAPVPTWPRIVATVGIDDLCQVVIDGAVHRMDDIGEGPARAVIMALVRDQAQDLGRTVRMDTLGPEGAGQMLVTPQGGIEAAGDDAPPTCDRPTPAATVDHITPAPPEPHGDAHPWSAPLTPEQKAELFPAPAPTPHVEPAAPPPPETTPTAWQAAPTPDHSSETEQPPAAPTLADLLGGRTTSRPAPAQQGWRAGLRSISGGAISPRPGRAELAQREAAATIARHLDGPKTVVVVNTKGGAPKTTVALLLAATFGMHRGYTLAWDNNESLGTLGWRAKEVPHTRTAIDLLADLSLLDSPGTRVGDLDAYVRAQTWGHFDVLASNEDAATNAVIDGPAFERMHATLARFYRVMVVDTGNNPLAPNWTAALAAADELVFSVREDTGQNAAWLADRLHATGNGDLVTNAVTVVTASARSTDPAQGQRLREHFSRLTRTVISVPHDPSLISGGPIDYAALSPASRNAWLHVTAAVTDGL